MCDGEAKRPLRVAVIDDDPDMVKIIKLLLETRGFEAVGAYSGEDGLELVQREAPDVVLLDIMMPGLDGFEVCHELKSDEETRGIPVIFVTAMSVEDCAQRASAAVASGYIGKPFKPAELIGKIEGVSGGIP